FLAVRRAQKGNTAKSVLLWEQVVNTAAHQRKRWGWARAEIPEFEQLATAKHQSCWKTVQQARPFNSQQRRDNKKRAFVVNSTLQQSIFSRLPNSWPALLCREIAVIVRQLDHVSNTPPRSA